MFEIKKNVTVPPRTINAERVARPSKYPFAQMEAGDAFEVPAEKAKAVKASLATYKRQSGKAFTTRTSADGVVTVYKLKDEDEAPADSAE